MPDIFSTEETEGWKGVARSFGYSYIYTRKQKREGTILVGILFHSFVFSPWMSFSVCLSPFRVCFVIFIIDRRVHLLGFARIIMGRRQAQRTLFVVSIWLVYPRTKRRGFDNNQFFFSFTRLIVHERTIMGRRFDNNNRTNYRSAFFRFWCSIHEQGEEGSTITSLFYSIWLVSIHKQTNEDVVSTSISLSVWLACPRTKIQQPALQFGWSVHEQTIEDSTSTTAFQFGSSTSSHEQTNEDSTSTSLSIWFVYLPTNEDFGLSCHANKRKKIKLQPAFQFGWST